MATVLLLRHGRTAANAHGGLAGRSPVGLDDTGRAQATRLRQRLSGLPLAAVVSSPLPRCRETVALAVPEASVALEERLIECGYGNWEGRSLRELAADPLWPVVQHHPSAATFPGEGGEPMAAMAARAVTAVREWDAKVTAEHGPRAIWLACSHGDVIKAVVADALGLHLDLFQRIVIDPGSLTAIHYTPARPFLLRLGETDQLPLPVREAGPDAPDGGRLARGRSAPPFPVDREPGRGDAGLGESAGGGSFGKVET